MMQKLSDHVSYELTRAQHARAPGQQFAHLERAHILSQYSTSDHVRVHWAMLRWGFQQRDLRECIGQIVRLVGAATKTAIGFIPAGNTGGANVSAFRPMPIPADLAEIIDRYRT